MSPNNTTQFSHQPRTCPTLLSKVVQPLLNLFYSEPVSCSTIDHDSTKYFLEYALWVVLLLAVVKISDFFVHPIVRRPRLTGGENVNIEMVNVESIEGEGDVGVSTSLESMVS
jgi:hypothetical protein